MNATVEYRGLEAVLANARLFGAAARSASRGALYRRAEAIMADSKEHYVPVDQGILRDSGHVELPEDTADGITVTLGYGGAAEAYAVVQHEDLSLNHPNGGGPKYLERPLLEHGKTLLADMADELRAELGITS